MPSSGTQRPLEAGPRRRRIQQLQARLAAETDDRQRERLAAQVRYFQFKASPPRVPRPQ